jgi:hypothetical protein
MAIPLAVACALAKMASASPEILMIGLQGK